MLCQSRNIRPYSYSLYSVRYSYDLYSNIKHFLFPFDPFIRDMPNDTYVYTYDTLIHINVKQSPDPRSFHDQKRNSIVSKVMAISNV